MVKRVAIFLLRFNCHESQLLQILPLLIMGFVKTLLFVATKEMSLCFNNLKGQNGQDIVNLDHD